MKDPREEEKEDEQQTSSEGDKATQSLHPSKKKHTKDEQSKEKIEHRQTVWFGNAIIILAIERVGRMHQIKDVADIEVEVVIFDFHFFGVLWAFHDTHF